jgi:hypothetical protein
VGKAPPFSLAGRKAVALIPLLPHSLAHKNNNKGGSQYATKERTRCGRFYRYQGADAALNAKYEPRNTQR